MPFMQAMASRANAALTKEGLRGRASPFAEPGSLVAGLEELGDFDLDRLLQPAAKEV